MSLNGSPPVGSREGKAKSPDGVSSRSVSIKISLGEREMAKAEKRSGRRRRAIVGEHAIRCH